MARYESPREVDAMLRAFTRLEHDEANDAVLEEEEVREVVYSQDGDRGGGDVTETVEVTSLSPRKGPPSSEEWLLAPLGQGAARRALRRW